MYENSEGRIYDVPALYGTRTSDTRLSEPVGFETADKITSTPLSVPTKMLPSHEEIFGPSLPQKKTRETSLSETADKKITSTPLSVPTKRLSSYEEIFGSPLPQKKTWGTSLSGPTGFETADKMITSTPSSVPPERLYSNEEIYRPPLPPKTSLWERASFKMGLKKSTSAPLSVPERLYSEGGIYDVFPSYGKKAGDTPLPGPAGFETADKMITSTPSSVPPESSCSHEEIYRTPLPPKTSLWERASFKMGLKKSTSAPLSMPESLYSEGGIYDDFPSYGKKAGDTRLSGPTPSSVPTERLSAEGGIYETIYDEIYELPLSTLPSLPPRPLLPPLPQKKTLETSLWELARFKMGLKKSTSAPLSVPTERLYSDEGIYLYADASSNPPSDRGVENRETSFWWAVERGQKEMVERLIQEGVDVNVVDQENKSTPLIAASRQGHLDVVRLLIENGAEIDRMREDGQTPLHVACQEGHGDIVLFLLKRGARVNLADHQGWTPLHWAVLKRHPNTIEILLNRGAEVQSKNNNGHTPQKLAEKYGYLDIKDTIVLYNCKLCRAAAANDLQLVESLVSSGADINERDVTYKETPLHWAAKKGHVEVVNFLLERGADYEARNTSKKTASGVAKKYGHSQISVLIKSWATKTPEERRLQGIVNKLSRQLDQVGVNGSKETETNLPTLMEEEEFDLKVEETEFPFPKYETTVANEHDQSSLLANQRLRSIVHLLKSNNFNLTNDNFKKISDFSNELESLEKEVEERESLIQDLLSNIEDLNESQSEIDKIKHEITNLRKEKSKLISHYNTFIINSQNVTTSIGPQTSEHRSKNWFASINNLRDRMLRKAARRTGTISFLSSTTSTTSESNSLLLDIVTNGDEFTLLELLRTGCDINATFEGGHSALHVACKHNSVDVVQALLEAGATIDAITKRGATPIMTASEKGGLEIVQLLLKHNAKVNATTDSGISALYLAVKKGHTAVVKCLLENGADVNLCSSMNMFPLHEAAQNGSSEIARLLLRNGADVNALNDKNQTAADVAQKHMRFKCKELILKWPFEDDEEEETTISSAFASMNQQDQSANETVNQKQTVISSPANVAINFGTLTGAMMGDVEEINFNNRSFTNY